MFHIVRRELLNRLFNLFETLCPTINVLLVVQVFLDNHVHQTIYPGDIRTQVLTQPFIGVAGYGYPPRIDNDQLGAFLSDRTFDKA